MYIYIRIYIYTYIHIYVYICIHTFICINIHLHTNLYIAFVVPTEESTVWPEKVRGMRLGKCILNRNIDLNIDIFIYVPVCTYFIKMPISILKMNKYIHINRCSI
jgi:hypothetical protein